MKCDDCPSGPGRLQANGKEKKEHTKADSPRPCTTIQGISSGGVFAWVLGGFPKLHINYDICMGVGGCSEQGWRRI
jgi:hypothetical protein